MGNTTYDALLARGIGSQLAMDLMHMRHNITTLSCLSEEELLRIGIPGDCISRFRKRPPIPREIVIQIINDFRNTCTICRGEKSSSVVIHHIIPWEDSRSHEYDNLILLCPACHAEAHTTHEISRNLSPNDLIRLKELRLKQIKESDKHVFNASSFNQNDDLSVKIWNYFNHTLISRLNQDLIDLSSTVQFFQSTQNKRYAYAGTPISNFSPYELFNEALTRILESRSYRIIDNQTSFGNILALYRPCEIITLTAPHYFKNSSNRAESHGPGQNINCSCKRGKIWFKFSIDKWDATSNSAYNLHLSGTHVCTSILLVKEITKNERNYVVTASCLSIGQNIFPYTPNMPKAGNPYWEEWADQSDEDENEFEFEEVDSESDESF